jgi:hypothetical protein
MTFKALALVSTLALLAIPAFAADPPATPVQQEKHFEA